MKTIKAQLEEAIATLGVASDRVVVEYPPQPEHGDYSTNVAMIAAKERKMNPLDLAAEFIAQLEQDTYISQTFEKVEAVKPGFINFFTKEEILLANTDRVQKLDEAYGQSEEGSGRKVVVEYSSPNTNKPLHLGHLRNNFIGMALSNLYQVQGYAVVRAEVINDRGIHICKSMLAYQKWGNAETPESVGMKSDHFVAKYYVMYDQAEKKDEQIREEAQDLLRRWEAGDTEIRALWKQMNEWAEGGFNQTYEKIGSHFDIHEYESDIYDKGKDIVLNALQEGKAEELEGGAVAVDLSAYNLGGREDGKKVLVRSDGTTMYMTQDLYLAVKRFEEHKPDAVLYVVGDEQLYHFKVLFTILSLLGYTWVEDRYEHVPYGMVNLPEGKMKSREGTVVDADNLISELEDMARKEIRTRDTDVDEEDLTKRAEAIALAAVKFFILKVDPRSTVVYDPKKSLEFEGNTGPYILYTYARLSNILRKAGMVENSQESTDRQVSLTSRERQLLLTLSRYSEVVRTAAHSHKPHILAEYLFDLTAQINSWYAESPVLQAEESVRVWRLHLIMSLRIVIRNGLSILNIPVIEKM